MHQSPEFVPNPADFGAYRNFVQFANRKTQILY